MTEEPKESEEQKKVREYLAEMEALENLKEKDKVLKIVSKFPYPEKILSILLLLAIGLGTIKFLPDIMKWVISTYLKNSINENMFISSVGLNFGLIAILFITFLFAREVIKPWIKAGLTRKPILLLYTKNRT
ncbi:unnamed protein product, partial [marine sediment metagenome]